MLRVIGKVVHFVGIIHQIEEKLMTNMWIDMKFPFFIPHTSLVVLEGKKEGFSDSRGSPLYDWL